MSNSGETQPKYHTYQWQLNIHTKQLPPAHLISVIVVNNWMFLKKNFVLTRDKNSSVVGYHKGEPSALILFWFLN